MAEKKEEKQEKPAKRTSKTKKEAPKKKSLARRIVSICIFAILVLGFLGCASVAAIFWYYSKTLPPIFSYDDYNPRQVTTIFDNAGHPILELYDEQRRTVIPFSDIPIEMRNAMIAAEDAMFYEHKGLDYVGVLRAVYVNLQRGSFSQGSSTITQQVVKNLLLTPEKSISRKVQEVLLSRQLETALTKDEILAIYLNHVYFGHSNYGIERAARFYFGIHAKDLNLVQAATLAGLVQSPQRLSPIKHMERAVERRNYVLRQLYEKGFIIEDVYQNAIQQPIILAEKGETTLGKAPYFSEMVRQELIKKYGQSYVYTAGLNVHTTLDLDAQEKAEKALLQGLYAVDERRYTNRPLKNPKKSKLPAHPKLNTNYEAVVKSVEDGKVFFELGGKTLPLVPPERSLKKQPIEQVFKAGETWYVQISKLDSNNVPEEIFIPKGPDGSLVAIEPSSRHLIALVGGYDYKNSNFNRATQANRQTGSSFKTFVYGAALDARVISPSTVIDDAPKVFHIPGQKKPWSPQNSDKKFKGPMSVRTALAQSRNTVAVDVLERVGIQKTIAFVRKFGITAPLVDNYTLALGSSEMTNLEVTNAYASIADSGIFKDVVFITSIEKDGKEEKLPVPKQHEATSPEVAYLLTSMLTSVATEGTARKYLAKWKQPVAGKTGTTNDTKDAWFIGFTPMLACGVYVGHDTPKTLGRGEGGSSTALPIWADFMTAYHANLPVKPFPQPGGIVEIAVDKQSGLLPNKAEGTVQEVFIKGMEPQEVAPSENSLSDSEWLMQQYENRYQPTSAEEDSEDPGSYDPNGEPPQPDDTSLDSILKEAQKATTPSAVDEDAF